MADKPVDTEQYHEPDRNPTLGQLFEVERVRRDWGRKQFALAAGLPYEKYMRIKADVDLPTAEEMLSLGRLLGRSQLELEVNLKATVYHIVARAVQAFSPSVPTLRAARKRGPELGDAEAAEIEDLPLAIRRLLADEFHLEIDDLHGMADGLRDLSTREPRQQVLFMRGMAALIELEGEETWTDDLEALLKDDEHAPPQ